MNLLNKFNNRGQVIVLAGIFILFLAFVVFSTLGLAWKTQQRIALQHASDAAAYSRAVKVARGFNYFGYANRAIASQLTSMVIAHAYHTEISSAVGLYYNLALVWNQLSLTEATYHHACNTGWFVSDWICDAAKKIFQRHSREDCSAAGLITGESACGDLFGEASELNDDIRSLDSTFTNIMSDYNTSISAIQLSEQMVGGQLYLEEGDIASVTGLGNLTDESLDNKLKYFNDDTSSSNYSWLARAKNIANLSHASVTGSLVSLADDKESRIDMTDVANTARPLWVRNRAPTGIGKLLSPLTDRIKSITGGGSCTFLQAPFLGGTSGIFEEYPVSGIANLLGAEGLILEQPDPKKEGKGIYSIDIWQTFSCKCKHHSGPPSISFIGQPFPSVLGSNPAVLWTAPNNSKHRPETLNLSFNPGDILATIFNAFARSVPHNGNASHNFNFSSQMKFMRFNAQTGGTQHQPVNYRSISQDLSRGKNNTRKPWDIYDSAKYSGHIFGLENRDATVEFSTANKANSVSKALTYYHHPRDWKEPPNFWNPFWRAKLHPWAKTEFETVAGATGIEQGGVSGAISGVNIGLNMSKVFGEKSDVIMDGSTYKDSN